MFVKSLMMVIVATGLAMGLSGCSGGEQSPSSNAVGAIQGNLQITGWGPEGTKAGVVFNAQPDGSAALWIRVNKSLDGGVATIDFDNHPLAAAVQGELLTASVPASLHAAPGTYPLHVSVKQGVSVVQSNDVKFVVGK